MFPARRACWVQRRAVGHETPSLGATAWHAARQWTQQARRAGNTPEPVPEDLAAENARLRRENQELRDTNELLSRAAQVNPVPRQREMDMLLTAGELISTALVAMAVESFVAEAESLNKQIVDSLLHAATAKPPLVFPAQGP